MFEEYFPSALQIKSVFWPSFLGINDRASFNKMFHTLLWAFEAHYGLKSNAFKAINYWFVFSRHSYVTGEDNEYFLFLTQICIVCKYW